LRAVLLGRACLRMSGAFAGGAGRRRGDFAAQHDWLTSIREVWCGQLGRAVKWWRRRRPVVTGDARSRGPCRSDGARIGIRQGRVVWSHERRTKRSKLPENAHDGDGVQPDARGQLWRLAARRARLPRVWHAPVWPLQTEPESARSLKRRGGAN
jgi:hypothetical protein